MAGRPGLARQAFVEAELHALAHRAEFPERAVETIQELQLGAVLVRNPDLRDADEGLRHALRSNDADCRLALDESWIHLGSLQWYQSAICSQILPSVPSEIG